MSQNPHADCRESSELDSAEAFEQTHNLEGVAGLLGCIVNWIALQLKAGQPVNGIDPDTATVDDSTIARRYLEDEYPDLSADQQSAILNRLSEKGIL